MDLKECPICYESEILLKFECEDDKVCVHEYCKECLDKIDQCALCRVFKKGYIKNNSNIPYHDAIDRNAYRTGRLHLTFTIDSDSIHPQLNIIEYLESATVSMNTEQLSLNGNTMPIDIEGLRTHLYNMSVNNPASGFTYDNFINGRITSSQVTSNVIRLNAPEPQIIHTTNQKSTAGISHSKLNIRPSININDERKTNNKRIMEKLHKKYKFRR